MNHVGTHKVKIIVTLLFTAALALAGCTNDEAAQEQKQAATDLPVLVTSMTIAPQAPQKAHLFSGEIRGRHETEIGFRVPGKVIARHVETGSRVKPGDLLMQVDPRDLREAVTAARAQVDAAKSQYTLAADLLKRFKALYKQDYMSKAEFDRYQNNTDSAAAVLKQARAQLTQAANQLSYCDLKADSGGVVLDVRAESGQVVSAGMPVVIMAKGEEKEVEIFVPENQVSQFGTMAVFHVSFWALPDLDVQGNVRYVSPVADPVTRTYKARITLVNPPDTVRLGMTATAVSAKDREQGSRIFIPMSAVYQTAGTPMVWVIKDGKAALQKIATGKIGTGDNIEVAKGLSAGDEVITTGVHKLIQGQAVRTLKTQSRGKNDTL